MRRFKKIDWSILSSLLFTCVLTVIAACVESSGPLGAPNVVYAPTVSSVQMTLAQSALAPGQTTQATVVAKSADGKVVPGRVDFSSENPSIATVSSNGLVRALTVGVAMIQATVASRFATASVTVQSLASPVAVVAVALDSTSLAVGHAAKATAVAKDAAGNVITGQAVTWASLSPTIATLSSMGAVMAVAPGSATIKGTISGISGSASLTVVQVVAAVATVVVAVDSTTFFVGHHSQASAIAKDASGNVISGGTVTWGSLSPSIATVSSAGVVTAVAAGSATIQATVSGTAGSTPIAVVDLAFSNFSSGVFTPPYIGGNADVDIVDDPTGSGRGKVARFHYAGTNQDRNRFLQYTHPARFGQTIYSRGQFYYGPGTDFNLGSTQRKLLYWQPHVDYSKYGGKGGPVFFMVILATGPTLNWWIGEVPRTGPLVETMVPMAQLVVGRWYTIETQITMESSVGAGDGITRVWLDGALVLERLNCRWTDPAWIGQPVAGGNGTPLDMADVYFEQYLVGQQVNSTGAYDEYRYWDNVAFSTKRIGQ